MSLAKSVTLSTGVVVGFWTLSSLNLNASAQIATVLMNGYLDSTAYANNNDPVTNTTISITFVPTNVLPGGVTVLAALYNKIALDPFFESAIYTNDGF